MWRLDTRAGPLWKELPTRAVVPMGSMPVRVRLLTERKFACLGARKAPVAGNPEADGPWSRLRPHGAALVEGGRHGGIPGRAARVRPAYHRSAALPRSHQGSCGPWSPAGHQGHDRPRPARRLGASSFRTSGSRAPRPWHVAEGPSVGGDPVAPTAPPPPQGFRRARCIETRDCRDRPRAPERVSLAASRGCARAVRHLPLRPHPLP